MYNLIKFFFYGIIRKTKKFLHKLYWLIIPSQENKHLNHIIFNQPSKETEITVLVFHDGRNHYLRKTLSLMKESLNFPTQPYIILLDDQPIKRDFNELKNICLEFGIDRLELNEKNLGLGGILLKVGH